MDTLISARLREDTYKEVLKVKEEIKKRYHFEISLSAVLQTLIESGLKKYKHLIILALILTTGCNKTFKVLPFGLTQNVNATQKMSQDITILTWGQSNSDKERMQTIGAAITTGDVVVYDYHVSNTSSYFWANPANYQPVIDAVAKYQPDFVLCIQGESDLTTPWQDYYANMAPIWSKIHMASPRSYLSQAMDNYYPHPSGQGDARRGQWEMAKSGLFHLGPDVDKWRGPTDQLHFDPESTTRIALEWANIIFGKPYTWFDHTAGQNFN